MIKNNFTVNLSMVEIIIKCLTILNTSDTRLNVLSSLKMCPFIADGSMTGNKKLELRRIGHVSDQVSA